MTNRFTKIAVAATVAGAMIVPATAANAASKTERAIIGAILGGVAGAAVTGGDTDGVVLGAAAGGALGVATAKNKKHRYQRSYRSNRPYAQDSRYRYQQQRYDQRRYDSRYGYYDSYGRYQNYGR